MALKKIGQVGRWKKIGIIFSQKMCVWDYIFSENVCVGLFFLRKCVCGIIFSQNMCVWDYFFLENVCLGFFFLRKCVFYVDWELKGRKKLKGRDLYE